MKLIFCPECHDIFKLSTKEVRECDCGKCKGKYVDNLNAVYNDGIPLGILNNKLGMAIANQPTAGYGQNFDAFVIAKNVSSMIKTDNFDQITTEDFE